MISIDGNFISDASSIDSILPVDVKTTSIKEGGAFDFKPETEITLKNGNVFRTAMSPEDVMQLLNESDKTIPEKIPPTYESLLFDSDSLDAVLDQLRKITEHLHTLSEFIGRLTMHITEGGEMLIRDNHSQ